MELNRKSHKEVLLDTSKEVCLETNAGEAIYNKHIIYTYIYIYIRFISRHQTTGQSQYIKVANESFENVANLKYLGTTLTNFNCIHK